GAGEILLTSMDRDGTRAGYDLELTRAVVDRVGIPVIASGGAGTLEHLYDGLVTAGAGAALVASIFHYGEHSVHDAKTHLAARGVSGSATCRRASRPTSGSCWPSASSPRCSGWWPRSCWHRSVSSPSSSASPSSSSSTPSPSSSTSAATRPPSSSSRATASSARTGSNGSRRRSPSAPP